MVRKEKISRFSRMQLLTLSIQYKITLEHFVILENRAHEGYIEAPATPHRELRESLKQEVSRALARPYLSLSWVLNKTSSSNSYRSPHLS